MAMLVGAQELKVGPLLIIISWHRGRPIGPNRMVPVVAAYVSDILEALQIAGLSGVSSSYPSVTHLVHADHLDKHRRGFPHRTAADTEEVGMVM